MNSTREKPRLNGSAATSAAELRAAAITRVSYLILAANFSLVVLKYFFGFWGRSTALIADAGNSLSDCVSDVAAVFSLRMSCEPADRNHSYGHGKIETLATAVCGLGMVFVAIWIFAESAKLLLGFFTGTPLEVPNRMALVGVGGTLAIKGALYRTTRSRAKNLESPFLNAKAWDHLMDALISCCTLVGVGGAILLGDKGALLDPLAACLVGVFVLKAAWPILRDSIGELLEASLPSEQRKAIANILKDIPEIQNFHHLRTRRIGPSVAIDVHILVDPTLSVIQGHEIATEVEVRLRGEFKNRCFLSIHVEPGEQKGNSFFSRSS